MRARAKNHDGQPPGVSNRPAEASARARIPSPRGPEPDARGSDRRLPGLPSVYLPRPELCRQLEAAVCSSVALVVAPAGAGKTVGVAGWLRRSGRAAETLWVDATGDLDSATMAALLRAVGPERPDHGRPAEGAGPSLLVVDDAHRLPASTVHHVDQLLMQEPRALRLMLLSRWDLAFDRLVPELLGDLSVMRGEVFRLDHAEAAVLIAHHARSASEKVAQAVMSRTQGWCAAVVLTAKAVGASPDPEAEGERGWQEQPVVLDQVASEVFAALTPRQRHLLLCTVGEDTLTARSATHLTGDAAAGEILHDLERTGLLVTRLGNNAYRIHPLLHEVARRRVVAGGVEVVRARATVLRAIRLDLAQGEVASSFHRLLAIEDIDQAAVVLGRHGVTLVLDGHRLWVRDFARHHPEAVEAHRETWLCIALERWLEADTARARHWLDRLLVDQARAGSSTDHDRRRTRTAFVRLLLSRFGRDPVLEAIHEARAAVGPGARRESAHALEAALLCETGVALNRVGDLGEAQVALSAAVLAGRSGRLPELTASALSHLALNQYMSGREHACLSLADEALALVRTYPSPAPLTVRRARLARDLALGQAEPWRRTATVARTTARTTPTSRPSSARPCSSPESPCSAGRSPVRSARWTSSSTRRVCLGTCRSPVSWSARSRPALPPTRLHWLGWPSRSGRGVPTGRRPSPERSGPTCSATTPVPTPCCAGQPAGRRRRSHPRPPSRWSAVRSSSMPAVKATRPSPS